ncbi:orotidine-5'-phosphate decarboxylase [Candidatus Fermentibacterales bacterium]|nr:orotidine-5'-phosphate decarboxylase [Candidatus Fermentibacterales bacterium]
MSDEPNGISGAKISPLYVAVTEADLQRGLLDILSGLPLGIKIGLELFTSRGPDVARTVREMGFSLFLDLKFHDIPFTVAGAVRSACSLRPDVMNVHGLGGLEMMRAAAEASAGQSNVIAVTLLTSLDLDDVRTMGMRVGSVADTVVSIALRARSAGLAGVVCSPLEIAAVRAATDDSFLIVAPGIRPASGSPGDDQKRVATPSAAVLAGASAIVVGRPITGSEDPGEAALGILDEMERARERARPLEG